MNTWPRSLTHNVLLWDEIDEYDGLTEFFEVIHDFESTTTWFHRTEFEFNPEDEQFDKYSYF